VLIAMLATLGYACRSHEQIFADQHKALTSLRATAVALGEAWLSGAVSSTYVRTALETTQQLLEKQRAALAAPDLLADPAAVALSTSENELARTLALLWKAVGEGDSVGVRRHLSTVASSQTDVP
jgi:predicted DNA-binding transcriptional regulator YafY